MPAIGVDCRVDADLCCGLCSFAFSVRWEHRQNSPYQLPPRCCWFLPPVRARSSLSIPLPPRSAHSQLLGLIVTCLSFLLRPLLASLHLQRLLRVTRLLRRWEQTLFSYSSSTDPKPTACYLSGYSDREVDDIKRLTGVRSLIGALSVARSDFCKVACLAV
jgi:hypothetical protein